MIFDGKAFDALDNDDDDDDDGSDDDGYDLLNVTVDGGDGDILEVSEDGDDFFVPCRAKQDNLGMLGDAVVDWPCWLDLDLDQSEQISSLLP